MAKGIHLPLFLGVLLGSGVTFSGAMAQDTEPLQATSRRSEAQVSTWLGS